MLLSKLILSGAVAASAVAFVSGTASAGDWQALKGISAAPLNNAEMSTVKGKATLDDVFNALGGSDSVVLENGSTVRYWASEAGTELGISGIINASEPFSFKFSVTYNPDK